MTQVYYLMLQEPRRTRLGWRCDAVDIRGIVHLHGWGLSPRLARRSAEYAKRRYYFS
jgi:hypothetical protein